MSKKYGDCDELYLTKDEMNGLSDSRLLGYFRAVKDIYWADREVASNPACLVHSKVARNSARNLLIQRGVMSGTLLKNIGFLIEAEIWEDDEEHILSVLSDKGIPFLVHPCEDFDTTILNKIDTPEVFCYGSLQWIAQIQASHGLRRGYPMQRHGPDPRLRTICSMPNFDCQVYYPHFQDFLFNNTHQMITLADFTVDFDRLLEQYGGKLFMRPCTGFKNGSISGGVFDRISFDEYIEFFQEAMKPEDMLVVDRVRNMDYEWRTIIHNGLCVTGCQYGSLDAATQRFGFDPAEGLPDRVQSKSEEIAQAVNWAPDPMYVLDIVESEGELFVMEINALSTSGWYDCDIGILVDAILDCEGV